jgi:glutamine amidotransferase
VGAHNGDIPNLDDKREALQAEIAPRLRRFVLGETDSELIFFQFLSRLSEYGPLSRLHRVRDILGALRSTVARVRELCDEGDHRSLLTLMVTDGQALAVVQGGKPLFYSTYKGTCPERDVCASLSPECEAPTRTGFVNHLIISSERLQGENVWVELQEGDMMAVDHRMQVVTGHLLRVELPVLGSGPMVATAS